MVLWEITVATAYFLGLKRTYRLALRIQRRLVGPNHPRIRDFLHRRTRSVFDIAVRVHQNIQQRDLEVGRNVGSWILRWLDRMKPSAEIRVPPQKLNSAARTGMNGIPKPASSVQRATATQRSNVAKATNQDSKGRLLFSSLSVRPKSFPAISMMMQQMRPSGMNAQFRHLSHSSPCPPTLNLRIGGRSEGVFRKDIALWMLAN